MVRGPFALCLVSVAIGALTLLIGLGGLASQRDGFALFCFVLAAPVLQAVAALAQGGRG